MGLVVYLFPITNFSIPVFGRVKVPQQLHRQNGTVTSYQPVVVSHSLVCGIILTTNGIVYQ